MRKFLVISSLFIVLTLSVIPYSVTTVYAAGASLSLSPAVGTFNKGCSFSVDIKLDTGGARTDGTDAILFYDPTRLSAVIKSGTIYSDYPGNNVDSQNGRITVSGLASVSTPFSGSGILATIDFTVLATAPAGVTKVKFDFDPNDKSKTTDSNVVERDTIADVLNQVIDGSYTIGSGSCNGKPQGSSGSSEIIVKTPPETIINKTPPELQQAADTKTTVIIGAVGSILLILGILGLAIL